MKVPVSVSVVARNEEHNLPRALASVEWAEECIVIVDSTSSDATEAIARESGAQVIVRPWEGNKETKQFALEQATLDWVLILDADEAITPELAEEVRQCVTSGTARGYEVTRVTYHLGRWIRHGDYYPDWQLRLLRPEGARYVGVNPHGHVEVPGTVERLQGEIQHWSYRNMADQVERIQEFSTIQARAMFEEGRRVTLADLVLSPIGRFLRAYVLKRGFLDGVPGFVIAAATAFLVLLKYTKLWELEKLGDPARPGVTTSAD